MIRDCEEEPDSQVNSPVIQLAIASELIQIFRLPRCLCEALYLLQLRVCYVGFFFMAEKAYHGPSSATLHSDSRNKAEALFEVIRGIGPKYHIAVA
jgi:hypothetical protein